MKVKEYLLVFVILFMTLSSLATINMPVKAAPPTPYVKVYVDQSLGYIPGQPSGQKVSVDIIIEVRNITDDSAEGIVGWGMDIQVDPDVLNISRAKGATSGYFLWEFVDYGWTTYTYFYDYPTLLQGDKNSTTGLWDELVEIIMPLPLGGAGEGYSGLKLVTLEFTSKSETTYSLIDLINIEYLTPDNVWHPVDEVIDGEYNPSVYHNLTVNSTPIDGINFTIGTTTYTTNEMVELEEGFHNVIMPSTWKVNADQYNFVEWEDNSTNTVRAVSLTTNMTITATYELAKQYILTVNSLPIAGINFTVNGITNATNWFNLLPEGSYAVSMPLTWMVGADQYNFVEWEDNSINPVRTISLTTNMTIIANYELYVPEYPAIYIEPAFMDTTLTPGENFTISMKTDYNGTDIQGWQFTLTYNPLVLNGTSVINGDLITKQKHSTASFFPGTFNNIEGKLGLTAAIFVDPNPNDGVDVTSGPGTLANVTFTVVGYGRTDLAFGRGNSETILAGWNKTTSPEFPYGYQYLIIDAETMPDHIQDSYFSNIQPIHNVAVVDLIAPSQVVVEHVTDISVTVMNGGNYTENGIVTLYYNTTEIETKPFTLDSGKFKTISFIWDTSGVAPGFYVLNATATISGDEYPSDNTKTASIELKLAPAPMLYMAVIPENTTDTTLTPGKNYTVSIYTNYNGSDIWGYQFMLTYNPRVLEGVEVVNGDLITGANATFIAGDFNNTIGKLGLTAAFGLDPTTTPPTKVTFTGPGILANITFLIVGEGESPIEFVVGSSGGTELKRGDGTNIIDYFTDLDPDPRKGKILNGLFQNVEGFVHDVAVISLDFSPNNVTAGELVTINVTIKNKGTVTEEVSVTVYWGFAYGIPLHLISDPETVTLGSGENKTIGFTWDTTEVTTGIHPLTAVVDLLGGVTDVNPDDNMLKIDDAIACTRVSYLPKLLVVDTPSSEDTGALDILGYEYTLVTPTEFATVDLYQYNVLFIGWRPGDTLVDALLARASEIDDWVAAGNGIVALSEHYEVNRWAWLPLWASGPSSFSGDTVHILNPAHPVMSGLTDTELSGWGNSYHGYFISYDPAWEALAEGVEADQTITLAATYGAGRIAITYQDPDFHFFYRYEEGAGKLLTNMIEWVTPHIRYEHELTVTLDAPTFLEPSDSSLLNATVYNHGLNNETNVELELFINDVLVDSTVIAFLPANASYTISYMWTPTAEGTYNVTAYALPVPSENVTINNVATKLVTVIYPLIRPIEGQWANYTFYYMEDDRITSEGKLTFTYDHYVSPYLINITMWQELIGYNQTYWMVVNIMNREIESSGPMAGFGQWFFGWIETDIALGSTVNIMSDTATVVGSKIIEVNGYFIDCWELEYQDYYSGMKYIFWYDKVSGLWIGMEYEDYSYYYYSMNLTLLATNIPIGVLPVASFTYTPSDPFIGETMTFDASTSYDPNGTIVSYTWDFGDNATGTGLTVNYVYTEAGTYTVTLSVVNDKGLTNTATATVTVSRTTLDVEVDVGSIHFRGEIAEFYVLVSSMGEPVDATINVVLYYSNGTLEKNLNTSVEHVTTGLYRVPYTLPIDAPTGTYVLVANASLFTIKGSSLKSFLLSPTLTDAWLVDIEDDTVTIKTDISTIKVSLESINAKIEHIIEMLPFKNKVAVIETDIGIVRADLTDINAELIALDGKTATIKTDVGTIKTDNENIELEVTNVDGDIATISTILGTIEGRVLSIQGNIATIETDIGMVEMPLPLTQVTPTGTSIEWALLLSAAIAFIISIAAILMRKLKRTKHTKLTTPHSFF